MCVCAHTRASLKVSGIGHLQYDIILKVKTCIYRIQLFVGKMV